jgi:tetratricopeptide (TPR) repeat protein
MNKRANQQADLWPRISRVAGICALLVVLIFIVFGRTLGFGFVNFDDDQYVFQNPVVSRGLSLHGLEWAFTHVHSNNWHPLTTLVHMLNCQMFGLRAGGHHLINVLLHAACAVFLFLLLLEMTGALWRSGFVAAVFAIHPLRVESVAWVSELKDVLSGLFFMLTLWTYARYARRPESWGRYAMVVVWLALGLMSKPMLVTVPFVLLLLDYWPLRRLESWLRLRPLLWEKLPLCLLALLSCVATVLAQKQAIEAVEPAPFSVRLANAVVAYAVYLGKFIWPGKLAALYPLLIHGPPAWQVIASAALLAALSVGAWLLRKKQPYLLVGWLWYLGMLVPVIGILQVGHQAYADRYTYLPQIGLCLAGTWAAADWAGQRRELQWALGAMAPVIVCAMLIAAWKQTEYWRNSETLWTHTLDSTRENFVALNNLGLARFDEGHTEEAMVMYREALRINPADVEAHINLGNALSRQGRLAEAIARYREAIAIDSADADAHSDLGVALCRQGRTEEGAAEYREAMRINPVLGQPHYDLGLALFQQGRAEEAIAQFREALEIDPNDANTHGRLANALVQNGATEAAIAEYRTALQINPAYVEARNNLGLTLFRQGRTEEAIAQYRAALQNNPAYLEAQYNLGNALLRQGRTEEAIAAIQKALDLQPANTMIQNNLAWILATAPQPSLRDGPRAVQLAVQASQASGGNNPVILHTLAAAYAAAGQYPSAVETAQRALQLAQANGSLASALPREIELYKAGQPLPAAQR